MILSPLFYTVFVHFYPLCIRIQYCPIDQPILYYWVHTHFGICKYNAFFYSLLPVDTHTHNTTVTVANPIVFNLMHGTDYTECVEIEICMGMINVNFYILIGIRKHPQATNQNARSSQHKLSTYLLN